MSKKERKNETTEIKFNLILIVAMLALMFLIKSCTAYQNNSYIEGINNSAGKYVQKLNFYKTYYSIEDGINDRPYKVLNIIAKEGTWRFKKTKNFYFNKNKEWFIINEKFLCPTETFTKDCPWAL